jgi:hypothetical protein
MAVKSYIQRKVEDILKSFKGINLRIEQISNTEGWKSMKNC